MKQKLLLTLSVLFVLLSSFYNPLRTPLPMAAHKVKFSGSILSRIINGSTSTYIVYTSVNDVSSGGTPTIYGSISPGGYVISGYQASVDSIYIQAKIAGGTFSHVDIVDDNTSAVLDTRVYNPSNPIYHLVYGGGATATMWVYP